MRLYFACSNFAYASSLIKNNVDNILFAFPYAKTTLLRNFENYTKQIEKPNLMVDSGAFSVWTLGETIDLDDYIDFCKKMILRFTHLVNDIHFVNLDVIPGNFRRKPTKHEVEESARKSRENYLKMREAGIITIPVFHQHENIKWLEKMIKDTDYIGISPANDISTQGRMVWMDKVYCLLKDKVKTHSFGGISKKILMRYPIYSGDSSSWTVHHRYGRGLHYKYSKKPKEIKGRIFMTDKEVENYKKLEYFITKLWKYRGVVWK